MKSIASLLFLFCYTSGICQLNQTDSSYACIAKWKKGEEKTFTIKRKKESIIDGKAEPAFNFTYEAVVTILDSTTDGYKIQWVFHLPALVKKLNPRLAEDMPVYEGLKMIFLTTKEGAFKELINWQEVKDAYVKMMLVSLPANPDDETKAMIEKSKELFNSKEMAESSLIPEIQLLYAPFGTVFSKKGTSTPGRLINPFSATPFPCIISEKIIEIMPEKDLLRFSQDQKIDKIDGATFSADLLKKMGIQADSVLSEVKEITSQLEVTEHHEFLISPSTGWISRGTFEKIAKNSDRTNKEFFTIALK